VISNAAPTISSIANQTTAEDTAIGPIAFTIGDDLTAAASLVVTGTSGNTNLIPHSGIVLGGSGTNRTVTLTPAANQNGGPATITLTVSDGSLTATNQFTLTVTGVDDPPTASDGQVTGVEDVAHVFTWMEFQVTDPDSPITTNTTIQIQSLPDDGRLEVFNGTSWDPATLLQTVTQSTMNAGRFRFVPDAEESGHDGYAAPGVGHLFRDYAQFDFAPVQPDAPGDPGPDSTLTIDLTPVADTPSVTDTSTPAETQTTSGLVIARNPADGAEVTHFRITSITHGTLFQNDGVSGITSGAFITSTEGQAGLRFTPSTGFSGNGGFSVQASTSNEASGLGGDTVNATITVTPRDQTITFLPIPDQEPSESVELSATATSGLAVTFVVSSGLATIANSNQLTFTGAGSVTITASQSGNAVWNPAPDVSRTFLVNTVPLPASPTLERWPLGGVKVRTTNLLGTDADGDAIVLLSLGPTTFHGGTVSTNTAWVFYAPATGFIHADTFAYVVGDAHGATTSGTFAYSPDTGTVLDSGDGQTLSVTFTPDDTSSFLSITTNVTLNVAKAALSLTADDASRRYGATNASFTGAFSGTQNSDSLTQSYNTTATTNSPIGAYAIVPAAGGNRLTNYTVTLVQGTLTITNAPLTIAADSTSRSYGEANPSFSGAISGIQNNEVITATYATTATASSPIGTYDIVPTPAGNTLTNYSVTLDNGTLTIGQTTLIVTANSTNRIFGASNPTFTGSLSGIVNSDAITASYASSADASSPVGTYNIVPTASGAQLTNYAVTANNGVLTVTIASSSASLASSANPALPGSNVTFSLTVSAVAPATGTPTGNVRFTVDGSPAGPLVTLSGGIATYTTSALSHGSHTVAATYLGSGNFNSSSADLSPDQIINTPPVAGADTLERYPTQGVKVRLADLLANDSDADSDSLAISITTSVNNNRSVTVDGAWVFFTPASGWDPSPTPKPLPGTSANAITGLSIRSRIPPRRNHLPATPGTLALNPAMRPTRNAGSASPRTMRFVDAKNTENGCPFRLHTIVVPGNKAHGGANRVVVRHLDHPHEIPAFHRGGTAGPALHRLRRRGSFPTRPHAPTTPRPTRPPASLWRRSPPPDT
jgi:hypothetical protein